MIPPLPKPRAEQLLLVDDEPHVRLFLRKVLDTLGFNRVAEAGTPEEALYLFKEFAFDAVLLDINLPGRTGIEVMPDIWAVDPDVPIIMVTAQVQASMVKTCLDAGASGYVVKSGSVDMVRESLRWALSELFDERESTPREGAH